MKVVLREEDSGVSEVVGTILILAMTVVLFSTIILWVSTIPTPVAQTRVDIQAALNPKYVLGAGGALEEKGDWVNMTHQGGESMPSGTTVMYISDQKSNGAISTAVIHLAPTRTFSGNLIYGLMDGSGLSWSVGQRFTYFNASLSSADKITVTIVDLTRSLVMWTAQLTGPAGARPPIFLNTYAARNNFGTPLDVQTNTGFYIFAKVMDPDGSTDLNPNLVFATITYYYGSGSCANPIQMFDDGRSSVTGDAVANDGIFTLFTNACTGNAVAAMDGSIVLFSATDNENHQSTTRMTLHVVPGPAGGNNGGGGIGGSGRPPNLRWNGNQGYNIFNATQWDTYGYSAEPTRTFKGGETVVLVVGSLTLQNVFGIDAFNVFDPYSGNPAQPVVYGATKQVGPASQPSTNSAFSFFQFVNGYYIYTYRFKLNDPATVGTNFYTTPPQYPRYYYFASYPLSVLLTDSANDRFTTTDSINITADSGGLRTFPVIQTFADSGYTQPSGNFRSTAVVYVQVKMLTVNPDGAVGEGGGQVLFGNVMIQDFAGGQELNRAPTNGIYSNLPICPPIQACSPSNIAIRSDGGTTSYRFSINLARVNQDPWVAGSQNYALTIASIKDTDESYASVSSQIVIQAPLYKMDIITGNTEGTNSAWGTKDYAYFYQDFNGFDLWKKLRVDYCYAGSSLSGVAGSGSTCPSSNDVAVAFADFWHDGTLGVAESFQAKSGYAVELYRRAVDASGAVIYLPVFHDTPAVICNAIATGDLTGDDLPEVVCGGTNGWIWYYSNNGNWTSVIVDQPGAGQQINSISIGDFNGDGWKDIAVAGANAYIKWYPNLGYGRFQNTGISDNWFAVTESPTTANITAGTYLTTYLQDGVYETIREAPLNIPLQTGTTSNSAMDNSALGWTFASAYHGATGQTPATGGNPNAFAQITAPFLASNVVAGYWYQPFTVTGSPAFTVNVSLNYLLSTNGATGGGAVTFYAFVDTTTGAPPQVPTGCISSGSGPCWTSGAITGTRGWTALNDFALTGLVPAPGTYYLKVAMYATYLATGSQSVGGFDNVVLAWTSQAGATSAMEQYYRMATLPTRPGTSFTFKVFGHEVGGTSPPDYDNFTFAYATNVVGSDPTTGTYTTMFTINSATDSNYQFAMPSSVAGKTVWIRILDTNRIVGDVNMDTLFLDYLTINANTPAGTTGVTLPGPTSTVNMIDAQDANGDGLSDLVAGTANGNVWKYTGSAGGLILAGGTFWYSDGGVSIVGVKWGNFSTAYSGLHIALSFGTTVRIVRGDVPNTVIANSLPAFSPSSAITAFGVGDINGDGWDDVVIGTNGGALFLWENLGGGTSWTFAVQVDNLGAPIYSLAIGDTTNSQYVGR